MLLLVATFDRKIVKEHFALTATFILALCISHPACSLFISMIVTHTLAYTYFGTIFKGIPRLLEEIIHSRECIVQKFVQKILQILSDLPASFTLIAF